MTTFRHEFERRVGPVVVLAGSLPRAVPFIGVCALLVAGLALGGALGAVLLLVLAALLGALLFLSWPALEPGPRAVRLAVVCAVVARAGTLLL